MKRTVSITLVVISVFLWSTVGAYGNEDRAIKRVSDLSHESGKLGDYHALIIAIGDYQDDAIPDLESPLKDARALDRILRKKYGFETRLLLDREATRETIDNTLRNLVDSTKEDDSILIYYAGHGDRDRTYDDGWWIPVDARAGRPTTYLDNTQVQKAMRSMKARHVLLISDSCYSGTLFGQVRAMPSVITEKYYLDLYNEKSRWGMTSGNKEPVADRGTGGHSVFAYHIIKALDKNDKPYQSTQEIYTRIAPIVSNNSEQTPLCRPIRNTGDQGGEFVFVASRGAAMVTRPSHATAPEDLPVESDVSSDDVLRVDGRDVARPPHRFRPKAEASQGRIPGPEEEAVSPDKEFYSSTLAMYKEERYYEAIVGFKRFMRKHPRSVLADDAQFRIGECYMSLKQYKQAILAYKKVIKNHPKGNKVPNAMLRQGFAFFKIKDRTSSILLLKKIIRKYPGSSEARIAKARLKAMK